MYCITTQFVLAPDIFLNASFSQDNSCGHRSTPKVAATLAGVYGFVIEKSSPFHCRVGI